MYPSRRLTFSLEGTFHSDCVPSSKTISTVVIFESTIFQIHQREPAGLRLDRQALIQAVQAQNAVTPAGVVQTADEEIRVDVTGGFRSEADLRNVNFVANGQIFRLSDIATIKRTYSDPPQPMFHFNGQPAIGIGISMRAGGDVLALGQNIEGAMSEIRRIYPSVSNLISPPISLKSSRPRWMISWRHYGRRSESCSP